MRESFGCLIGRPIECLVSRLTSYKVPNKCDAPNKRQVQNNRKETKLRKSFGCLIGKPIEMCLD